MFRNTSLLLLLLLVMPSCNRESRDENLSQKEVVAAQKLIGLEFTDDEIDTMLGSLRQNLANYDTMRTFPLPNDVVPSFTFSPYPEEYIFPQEQGPSNWSTQVGSELPADRVLPFSTVHELSSWIRDGKITSERLTEIYISRIKAYDSVLHCVITLMEHSALKAAQRADQEIASGKYRGLLHGIPFGVKDILAVEGFKTTWGSKPYEDQKLDYTATVVKKLEEAGAVLVAKLTSGALARGDVWFGGKTLNPWDTTQGASGSSAGSGSATAAGLVAFSIGTETLGSIISPSTRCGVTGLRPTFGAVSRYGVMTLAWSLDKVGPMCRSAEDCALVFDIIRGADPLDPSSADAPFVFNYEDDVTQLKVGYLKDEIEGDTTLSGFNGRNTIRALRSLGVLINPVSLPKDLPYGAMVQVIIRAEAAAAFDELLLTNQDDEMVEQHSGSRANSLRMARFIPAAEYIKANRHRTHLINSMDDLFQAYDVIIAPTFGNSQSSITNMSGHPALSVPTGFDDKGRPTSITFLGKLHGEAAILQLAAKFQEVTQFHRQKPPMFIDN